MKISELIAALEALKAEHGDLVCMRLEGRRGYDDEHEAILQASPKKQCRYLGKAGMDEDGPLIVELI